MKNALHALIVATVLAATVAAYLYIVLRKTRLENQSLASRLEAVSAELDTTKASLEETKVSLDRTGTDLTAASTLLQQTRSELKTKDEQLTLATGKTRDLTAKLDGVSRQLEERSSKMDEVNRAHRRLVGELRKEVADHRIRVSLLGDSLKVRMVGNILFPSGEVTLTDEGVEVLGRIGEIMKQVSGKMIRVEGHTDNVPIGYPLNQRYGSNWELSAARATNVVRFLIDRVGISPDRIEAVGRGEYAPVADNGSSEGRAKNRRIEIMFVPIPAAEAEEAAGDEVPAEPAAEAAEEPAAEE